MCVCVGEIIIVVISGGSGGVGDYHSCNGEAVGGSGRDYHSCNGKAAGGCG